MNNPPVFRDMQTALRLCADAFNPPRNSEESAAMKAAQSALKSAKLATDIDVCNGWKNHETNMIAGQVTNHPTQAYEKLANVLHLGNGTRDQDILALGNLMRDGFNVQAEKAAGFNGDLARAALARVDWRALAIHLLDETEINPVTDTTPAPVALDPRPMDENDALDMLLQMFKGIADGKSYSHPEFFDAMREAELSRDSSLAPGEALRHFFQRSVANVSPFTKLPKRT